MGITQTKGQEWPAAPNASPEMQALIQQEQERANVNARCTGVHARCEDVMHAPHGLQQ